MPCRCRHSGLHLLVVALLSMFVGIVHAGNILFIPPMLSSSHRLPMLPWADELARRGHNVLIWAPVAGDKLDKYVPKVAKIDQFAVPHDDQALMDMLKFDSETFGNYLWSSEDNFQWLETIMISQWISLPFCERLIEFHREKIDYLFATKWDLIIFDELFNTCAYMLVNMLKPVARAMLCTTKLSSSAAYFASVETPNSFVPNWGISYGFTDVMTLPQRIFNTAHFYADIFSEEITMMLETRSLRRFFPNLEHQRNARFDPDFVFVFFPRPLDFPRPLPPNIIHIGGLSSEDNGKTGQPAANSFPPKMLALIDRPQSKGFVIFAMGHFGNWSLAPPAIVENFRRAFAQLPQYSFIWTFNSHSPPSVTENVGLFPWIPQRELLKHSRAQLFISHCGGNSMNEAVAAGVPVLAVPFFGDQHDGATRIVAHQAGLRLHKYDLLDERIIFGHLQELLRNRSYTANMAKLSAAVSDQPASGLENAIFYSEFAVKHRGASFLKPGSNVSRYHCWIFLATVAASVLFTFVVLKLFALVFKFLCRVTLRTKDKRE